MTDDFFTSLESCLECSSVRGKLKRVEETAERYLLKREKIEGLGGDPGLSPQSVGFPQRPILVSYKELPKRSFADQKGKAALLHAIAHIEFNAINLGLDAAYRFRGMPEQFYLDWLKVAADEVRHFKLLENRLAEYGISYGDLPAHRGLWDMAEKTAHSLVDRMALIPRYLEARGLDVTPAMIEKFKKTGDVESAAVLELILEEEVSHVEAGNRWFGYLCDLKGLDRQESYFDLLQKYGALIGSGTLNREDRLRAGFSDEELDRMEQF